PEDSQEESEMTEESGTVSEPGEEDPRESASVGRILAFCFVGITFAAAVAAAIAGVRRRRKKAANTAKYPVREAEDGDKDRS
ncbi:MAG: hypothetical protein IK047_05590, partial [Clostridia bacterium]|nr:hypothetical protein [Clostridia bacterium]